MTGYKKYIDRIGMEEFIELFSVKENPDDWFTKRERERFAFPKNARSLAARYLVKKRVMYYLQKNNMMKDIEIINDEYGKPVILLSAEIKAESERKGIRDISCSLSHSRNHIAALTVIEIAQ